MINDKKKAYTFNKVRTIARWLTRLRPRRCAKCGYDKHINVCHIKPIHSFPLDAKISEINAQDNLIILCPNCHTELDHQTKQNAGTT